MSKSFGDIHYIIRFRLLPIQLGELGLRKMLQFFVKRMDLMDSTLTGNILDNVMAIKILIVIILCLCCEICEFSKSTNKIYLLKCFVHAFCLGRFNKENLLLSAAVAATEQSASISYDIPNISRYLDFINVMTYDLHGPWDVRLGLNAPLYEGFEDTTPLQRQLNVNTSIYYWLSQGDVKYYLIISIGFVSIEFSRFN